MVVRGSAWLAAIWTSRGSTPASKLVWSGLPNHAEWVSVTTGWWWPLPSLLRFSLLLPHHALPLMQPEWLQHPDISRNVVLSQPPGLRVRSVVAIATQLNPGRHPLRRRPHARRGTLHRVQLRAFALW
jgi:hypothetical protein